MDLRDVNSAAGAVIERLRDALNAHDIDAFVGCFDERYRSEQPAHPSRAFGGFGQVRKNWSVMFSEMPDIRAELLGLAVEGGAAWAEWHWEGTRADGSRFEMRGVTVMGIENDRITWARLYMEPVEAGGAGIEEAVDKLARGDNRK